MIKRIRWSNCSFKSVISRSKAAVTVYRVPAWIALRVLTANVLNSDSSRVSFKLLVFISSDSRIILKPGKIIPP